MANQVCGEIAGASPAGPDPCLQPFVTQCKVCHVLVSDSVSFQTLYAAKDNSDIQLLCFSDCHEKVCVDRDDLKLGVDGFDLGCAYFLMKCTGCGTALGKHYFTTPPYLDFLRTRYCFFQQAVSTTVLGHYGHDDFPDVLKDVNPCNNCHRMYGDLKNQVDHLLAVVNEVFTAFDENKTASQEQSMDVSQCTTATAAGMALAPVATCAPSARAPPTTTPLQPSQTFSAGASLLPAQADAISSGQCDAATRDDTITSLPRGAAAAQAGKACVQPVYLPAAGSSQTSLHRS
ncbi:uncharacterized protein LOC135816581 [Sycon ciliatum]|uniref:uncharacterized protein LOC135816581 n=1 Tax=Sycon ciliatum TaxID=27933 RepID=UPI0020A9311A|eukprot:scpid83162/ scgid18771/ 